MHNTRSHINDYHTKESNKADREFWVYESEKDEKSEADARGEQALPNMLVRCVNEFSDYGDKAAGSE